MKYLVSGKEMQLLDKNTSEFFHVPSVVLMEQAAVVFVRELSSCIPANAKVLVVSGLGNNGADGIAIARLLNQKKIATDLFTMQAFFPEKKGSELFELQSLIYHTYGYPQVSVVEDRYDVVIDALFGIGLTREIGGAYKQIVEAVNSCKAVKAAVDIPSGICADTGRVMGCAIKCDHTVTFSFGKLGHYLWPGCEHCGQVHVAEMGITAESYLNRKPSIFRYERSDIPAFLPDRQAHSNKGTYGKVLIIAGGPGMAGASVFAARAAYRTGCGLVMVYTHEANRQVIQTLIPEAIVCTWPKSEDEADLIKETRRVIDWSDAVVIGPGLGNGPAVSVLVEETLKYSTKPVVADADALNYLSVYPDSLKKHRGPLVITPHLGEMSRLTGRKVPDLQTDLIRTATDMARSNQLICVLKDFRTVTAEPAGRIWLNFSGNHGMATGGSGDVLTGVIGSLLAQKMEPALAASFGVYLHGCAGDAAREKTGARSLMAGDLCQGIGDLLQKFDV